MVDQTLSEISKEAVRAPKGTVLMRQGEVGRAAYFVVQGRLLVEREMDGENYVLGEIGPRDIVGEMAILDDSPRSATVTVVEDAMLVMLDKNRIHQIIRRSPMIAELILKLLCHKLRNAHSALQNMMSLENPEVWLKIGKNLRLCHFATQDPGNLYKLFADQLEGVIGIPRSRQREVLERLAAARIIRGEGTAINHVDTERLDCFIKYGREEFINEELPNPSDVKIYQAGQALLRYFGQIAEAQDTATLQQEKLAEAIIATDLWKPLRPAVQQQRAQTMSAYFIKQGCVKQINGDQVQILFAPFKAMTPPTQPLQTYEQICGALFNR